MGDTSLPHPPNQHFFWGAVHMELSPCTSCPFSLSPVAVPYHTEDGEALYLLWVSTGCAMGWPQVQQHFSWLLGRKDLSSAQKGKILGVCEELSPISTCLRHWHVTAEGNNEGNQCWTFFLEKVQHTGFGTLCSQRHWMKQISARLPGSKGFLKPGHVHPKSGFQHYLLEKL